MPNCVYCLQEASSWNWLSCQTHRTPVILVTTWLLRQLYNYEGVSNAVNCIADFGCGRLFKLIKLPQTLCCFHPGWDGYDHIRQWWWKRLASPSGWSWAKHYHTIAIIFKHLFIFLFTSTKSTTECYKYYKHIMQDPGLMDLLRSQ